MEISQVLSPNIEAFVQSCQKLSPTLVTTDSKDLTPAVQNSLGLKRKILGLIAPKQRTELQSVMRLACDFKIPMHPISTGCNWGFGSKLPYTENSFILDLSQLNKISNYDPVFGCVSIEPGVTQRQLMEFLNTQSSDYYLDMTGSSAESSVLGNTLERGIAYNSLRVEAVLRIEVLTLKGDLLQTGYAQWDQSLVKNLIKHSPGPNVEGLFFQSNLGIVANLTLQLKRKPDTEVFFNFNFPHVHLKEIIDTFGDLKRRYPWEAIVHIANRGRSQRMALHILQAAEKSLFQTVGSATAAAESITVQFPHEWIAIGSVKGPKPLVQEIVGHLKKGLKKKGRWVHFQTHQLEFAKKFTARLGLKNLRLRLELASTLSGLSQGRTTNATLQGFFAPDHSYGTDHPHAAQFVDSSSIGFIYCVPLAPLKGEHGERMLQLTDSICQTFGFVSEVTLNTITANVLEAVISISFNKQDSIITQRAQKCIEALHLEMITAGYIPYRFPLGYLHTLPFPESQKNFYFHLKNYFDPDDLLSRNRF